jgi:hypothetical protein
VAITVSGICGTDQHTCQGWTGQYGGSSTPRTVRFPLIQGHENVRRILVLDRPLTDFSDGGDVAISPHRHMCSKGTRLMGAAGEEPGAYLPVMRQLAHWRLTTFAIDRVVNDRFPLVRAHAAMDRSIGPPSHKVVFVP